MNEQNLHNKKIQQKILAGKKIQKNVTFFGSTLWLLDNDMAH
jgi:hypothetical protein